MSYIYAMVDTWNAGGTTFTAIKMNVTDTASAAGSLLMDLQVGGSSRFNVGKAGDTTLASAAFLGWSTDVKLYRDGAAVLALRNGANPQSLFVYNTWSNGGTDYERGGPYWSANRLIFGAALGGAGSARSVRLAAATGNYYDVNIAGAAQAHQWAVNGGNIFYISGTTGALLWNTDNSFDIGAVAATRPRNLFLGGYLTVGDGVTAPTATVGSAKIYVDTADGDLKIIFGDGTVKTIVTDT